MDISTNSRVNDFLEDIHSVSSERWELILTIRKQFFHACGELCEDIKYGGLVFFKAGELIGGLYTYKKYLSIEFSEGAEFVDERRFLEGNGKKRRHLKIHTPEDLSHKRSESFIQQAVSG